MAAVCAAGPDPMMTNFLFSKKYPELKKQEFTRKNCFTQEAYEKRNKIDRISAKRGGKIDKMDFKFYPVAPSSGAYLAGRFAANLVYPVPFYFSEISLES